jgi:hypothetical protein
MSFRYLSPVRANHVYTSKSSIEAMSKEERTEWRKTEKAKAKEDVEESKSKMYLVQMLMENFIQ